MVEYALKHRYLPEQLLDGAFLVAHLADAKALDCGGLGWGHEEARRLAAALEHATAQGALKCRCSLGACLRSVGSGTDASVK